MNEQISRRELLWTGVGLVAATSLSAPLVQRAGAQVAGSSRDSAGDDDISDMVAKQREKKGPPMDDHMVKEFVVWAHRDPEKVRAVIEREPRIVNCALDWGGGDFETALGGASHMGRRDIALYLLEHKARLDIFAATMLGYLEIVRAALTAMPQLIETPGPHGISLVRHAQAGGEQAKPVLEYLQGLVGKS